jgi:hypothetical protein
MDSEIPSKFVMEALKQGWTVSMNAEGELEFIKNRHKMSKKERNAAQADGYSHKFLQDLSRNLK